VKPPVCRNGDCLLNGHHASNIPHFKRHVKRSKNETVKNYLLRGAMQ
jgi:hypothetical protein